MVVGAQSIHEDVDIWVSVHSDGAQLRELVPLVEQGRLTRGCGVLNLKVILPKIAGGDDEFDQSA